MQEVDLSVLGRGEALMASEEASLMASEEALVGGAVVVCGRCRRSMLFEVSLPSAHARFFEKED